MGIKAPREDDELGPLEGEPHLPFPEHVHRLLERAIIDGRLAPGERITEVELAQRLAVSRTPVREAIRVLEAQGLVIRRRGRGTHIAPRTTFEEASAIYRARVPVESYLTALAAERISARELRSLSHLQSEFRAALTKAGAPDRSAMVAADSEFHLTIYRASQSALISIVRSYWSRYLRELSDEVYRSVPPDRFADQHDRIIDALQARDADLAQERMTAHIESSYEAFVLSARAATGNRAAHDAAGAVPDG